MNDRSISKKQREVSECQKLINELVSNKALKAKSLISTIFGDLGVPYGGFIWVESLSTLLAPLGISGRLVRTSLFRLAEDDWLESTRSGRKSYYGLTDLGASQTRLAENLIYYRSNNPWDGSWTLVFLVMDPINIEARNQLEEELAWIGFGRVANHVLAHPCVDTETVLERVKELGLLSKVVCMKCENIQNIENGFQLTDKDLAIECMPLAATKIEYQRFIDRFEKFLSCLDSLTNNELLSLRIILIDQFRKIVLNDPNLPKELLPNDWNGHLAYSIASKIYRRIKVTTDEQFLILLNLSGDTLAKKLDPNYADRFSA